MLVAVLLSQNLFAAQQKIYSVDSPEYETICDLYLATGHALPSSTGPWSESELSLMLDAINPDNLPPVLAHSYEWLQSRLKRNLPIQTNPFSLGFSADADIEFYIHTNVDGTTRTDINDIEEKTFVGRENWAYDLVHADPFLNLAVELDAKDSMYMYFALPLKTGFHSGTGWENEIGSTYVNSNIPGIQNMKYNLSLDPNTPYRAFISFGSAFWNLQLGRDRLNWGHGRTGNLVISDNLPYHDMLKMSAFSTKFKFTFLVDSFINKNNFYNPYIGSITDDKNELQGISLYIAHRIEGRFLDDRLAVTLTEALKYSSDGGVIDLRILNPVYFYHNLYTTSDSNSTIALEVDYTPNNGLNFYVQAILDDFAIPGGENAAGPSSTGYPNALGYLAGATWMIPSGSGILTFNMEGACIDPYTYLRYKTDPDSASEPYGLDYIVSTRTYVSSSSADDSVVYDEYFLGYRYGCDCIVANLNVEWKQPQLFAISMNAFFMAHGTHDKWTRWATVGGSGDDWTSSGVTPTQNHETGNYRYNDAGSRDAVCYTLDIGTSCSRHLEENLTAYARFDFVTIWNQYNNSGNPAEKDFQFVIGMKYSV